MALMNSRVVAVMLSLLSLTGIGLSTYIGLRLEPVIQRVEVLDHEFRAHLVETRPLQREFYESKQVQLLMLREQERMVQEIRGLRSDLDRLLGPSTRPSWLPPIRNGKRNGKDEDP